MTGRKAARSPAQAGDGDIGVFVAMATDLLRRGVVSVLQEEPEFHVLASTSLADRILPTLAGIEPDILIRDTDFQRSDPGLLTALHDARPSCGIVVMVNHTDDECGIRSLLVDPDGPSFSDEALSHLAECCLLAFRSSARGCVPKQADPERLRAAARTVAAGDVAAGPWLSALAGPERRTGRGADRKGTVSARELEVVTLVARGLENKEIAGEMGIREQTVKNHVTRVMRKLGLRNRQELVLFAVRTHLAPALPGSGEGAAR